MKHTFTVGDYAIFKDSIRNCNYMFKVTYVEYNHYRPYVHLDDLHLAFIDEIIPFGKGIEPHIIKIRNLIDI